MASQTTALPDGSTLTKPAYTDSADIAVINSNMDKIVTNINAENQALSNMGSNMYAVSGTSMTDIPSGADLNTYTTPGSYISRTSAITNSLSNCPFTGHGFNLKVESVAGGSGQYVLQTIRTTDANVYVRYGATGDWDSQALKSTVDRYLNTNTFATQFADLAAFLAECDSIMSNMPSGVAIYPLGYINWSVAQNIGLAHSGVVFGINRNTDMRLVVILNVTTTQTAAFSYIGKTNGTWATEWSVVNKRTT